MLRTDRLPLHSLICKALPTGHQFTNPTKALVHECPLVGLFYTKDNCTVFYVIKQAVANMQHWDWIKSINHAQDGRAAMAMLSR